VLGWPLPTLKYEYIFQILKYTEAILSNNTPKLSRFEITKMLMAVLRNKFIVSFIIIFGTLSFPYMSARVVTVQESRAIGSPLHGTLAEKLDHACSGRGGRLQAFHRIITWQTVLEVCSHSRHMN